jgi:hypothetical protein
MCLSTTLKRRWVSAALHALTNISRNTDTVARQDCNGTGCCTAYVESEFATGFDIKFVRHMIATLMFQPHSNRSSIWDTIDVTTGASIFWACLTNHSSGQFDSSTGTYYCLCDRGYRDNPYITDSCSRDKGNYSVIKKKPTFSYSVYLFSYSMYIQSNFLEQYSPTKNKLQQ